ncbi:MAG TPA: hypothetical protein VK814_00725 [Acidobacteriaceae bacterium]|jgi:hypothetical protein|nr:hypothetical protein [Acidobacteriaceae bacterium]
MSLNITTHITTRRPTLIRVWRSNGTHLTSTWLPTVAPNSNTPTEGGPHQ